MQQDLVVALPGVLLAHERQRVVQRADDALEARLDLAPLHAQAVDLALHVLDARLTLLQQQIGAALGLADDAPGFLLRVLANLVGELLRRDQRVAEVLLLAARAR